MDLNNDKLRRAFELTADFKLMNDIPKELPDYIPSDKFNSRIEKLNKRYNKVSFKMTYTRARKTVCIFVAVLLIMLSTLSVGAVRDAIANFFIEHFSTHATVEYKEESTKAKKYPEKIEKVYELTNIPKGYQMIDSSAIDTSVTTIYLSSDSQIVLQQDVKSVYQANMDNEKSSIVREVYNNQEYLIKTQKNKQLIITWDNGEYIFSLSSNLKKDSSLKLCNSLKVKSNNQ